MYFSRLFHPEEAMFLTWKEHLVSVLDLDNVIVGLDDHRTHTRVRPTTLIISLNDVKATEVAASDWTGKQIRFPIKSGRSVLVEPNGFEPLTSCLQSRRSTN